MDFEEVEYIAENKHVTIIPSFSYSKIYLISGEIGPFIAGLPVSVPIWFARIFKRKRKCRIVAPEWMNLELLQQIKEDEKTSKFFTKMPNEHYMVEAKLLLSVAAEDIPGSDEIRTVIKDIWDMRMAKLRTSMDALMKSGGSYGRLDHLTLMEINSVKPLLPHAMDHLFRLQKDMVGYEDLKKCVLSLLLNSPGVFEHLINDGRLFHAVGPVEIKALFKYLGFQLTSTSLNLTPESVAIYQ